MKLEACMLRNCLSVPFISKKFHVHRVWSAVPVRSQEFPLGNYHWPGTLKFRNAASLRAAKNKMTRMDGRIDEHAKRIFFTCVQLKCRNDFLRDCPNMMLQ